MDSKGFPEEPPPYSALPANDVDVNDLQYHVRSLPDRIRTAQQVRMVEQSFSDASLLDRIVPVLEDFLAELGARHSPVSLATLTLVPETAVPEGAILSGSEEMKRRRELSRVVKISIEEASKDSKSSDWDRFDGSTSSTGDSNGNGKTLWWRDEEMARRLAAHLQPRKETTKAPVERVSVVQAVVEQRIPQQKEKRGWNWGRRGSAKTPTGAPEKCTDVEEPRKDQAEDKAKMVVTAQEVAFRFQTEFGLWESLNGWGIVVAVTVKT